MVLLTWIRISTLPCVIHFAAISLYGTYKTDNFMFIYHEKRPFVLASFVVFYVVFFFSEGRFEKCVPRPDDSKNQNSEVQNEKEPSVVKNFPI